MPWGPVTVQLIGPPASGKLTIARQMREQWPSGSESVTVLDNHYFNNPVLEAIGADGTTALPQEVWDYTARVRDAVLDAVEAFAPSQSFILTNFLVDRQRSEVLFQKIVEWCERRGSLFVPVRLTCDPEELGRRAANDDRRSRRKWVDPASVRSVPTRWPPFIPDHPSTLTLDTTACPPEEAASIILRHCAGVAKESE
jgi:hypothetical protein